MTLSDTPVITAPRVCIVEDHPVLAELLGAALEREDIAQVEVLSPLEFDDVWLSDDDLPDLALVDLDLGRMKQNGIDVLQGLVSRGVACAMFTGCQDEALLGRCLHDGAQAILKKSTAFDAILINVSALLSGHPVNSAEERLTWLLAWRDRAEILRVFERLTPRESTVLRHLMDGCGAAEIADIDFVSIATVRTQVRAVLRKLNCNSQLEAVATAVSAGWRTR